MFELINHFRSEIVESFIEPRNILLRRHMRNDMREVARKVGLERRNRLSIYSSRSLVRLHTFEGFPNLPFGGS